MEILQVKIMRIKYFPFQYGHFPQITSIFVMLMPVALSATVPRGCHYGINNMQKYVYNFG